MASMSNLLENMLIDSLFRGGALTSSGTAGSTAVVKGIWTASTAYAQGDIVVPHANMTGAGGKFLQCVTAGTSGSTNTLAVPNPGANLTDNTVTWKALSGMPVQSGTTGTGYFLALYRATAGISPRSTAVTTGQTTVPATNNGCMYRCTTAGTTGSSEPTWTTTAGGTVSDGTAVWTEMTPDLEAGNSNLTNVEVSGGSYQRVGISHSTGAWSSTIAFNNTADSTGTGGKTWNITSFTFPTPTADWGWVCAMALLAYPGNVHFYFIPTVPKYINNGDSVSVNGGILQVQIDN